MTNSEINKYLRRIRDVRRFCKRTLEDAKSTEDQKIDAEDLQDMVRDLIDGMCKYTRSVFDDNYKDATRIQMKEQCSTTDEYQRRCEEIERARKSAHDGLIVNIKSIDLFCKQLELEPIYGELPEQYQRDTSGLMGEENRSKPGVVETRHAIADWTFDLVCGATIVEYMDLQDYDKNYESFQKLSKGIQSARGAKNTIMDLTDPYL